MKVVFDTNIILDSILRRDDYETAQSLVMDVAEYVIHGFITANSFTDIYYIAKKSIGDSEARRALTYILDLFEVLPVDGAVCSRTLLSQMDDVEDALVVACAEDVKADYIVTRDKGFAGTRYSSIPVITPDKLRGIIGMR